MTIDILSTKRKHGIAHPWNLNYPNNRFLAAANGEGYEDKTKYARTCGYTGHRRVLVRDGRVISHGNAPWHDWIERQAA